MAYFRSVLVLALTVGFLLASGGPAQTSSFEVVSLAQGSVISLATPQFVTAGKRTVKSVRPDGWVVVEVADENTNPVYFVPGDNPTRWLNVGSAISIQEMRPHQ